MEFEQNQKVSSKCAIVCGAPIENIEWLKNIIANYDYVIAADSGYNHLIKVNVKPDVLIGDMDSVSIVPNDVEVIKYPSKKDETDFSICLEYCCKNDIYNIDVFGAWGKRADHSIGAVLSMLNYSKKGLNIRFLTEDMQMFILSDRCVIPNNNGYVSLFPLESSVHGLTLENFEYPLCDFELPCCSPLGVSNKIIGEFGVISIKKGNLLVIIQNQ